MTMKNQKSKTNITPTEKQFTAINEAYKYFNKTLFKNRLPGCILNFSRLKSSHGFMAPERWKHIGDKTFGIHEISLTPTTLYRTPIEIFSTLVHEMAHLWQWEFGEPSRSGYHNKEWAAKMKEIGLIPSHNGKPGGDQTGQSMTHYLDPDGRYKAVFMKMPKKYILPFTSLDAEIMKSLIEGKSNKPEADDEEKRQTKLNRLRPPSPNKTKYSCPGCQVNVWGRPGLRMQFVMCKMLYTQVP